MPDVSIGDGARTALHLAEHFDRLKQGSLELRAASPAATRGYYTPAEDDQIRGLIVSYWQGRGALLDLVYSLDDACDRSRREHLPLFAIGYAAAVVLIDAARFLRDVFGPDPLAVRKLNQPEPAFNIPEGFFDTVQRSLTSPWTAWHMHQATQFYDEAAPTLRQLALGDDALIDVLTIIEQLIDRVRVTKAEFAVARLRVHGHVLVETLRRSAFGKAMYSIQELASRAVSELTTKPGHHPQLPPDVRTAMLALLRPGDVFITRKEHALTNYFLPGYWPHAALYLGDTAALQELGLADHEHVRPRWDRFTAEAADQRSVLEALKDGVRIRSVDSPLGSDAVTVIRPKLGARQVAEALARGLFHEGKAYDFDFDFTRSDRLVCTEVVYRSYEGIGGMTFSLTSRAGRMTLAAEDLLRLALERKLFEPVAAYCKDCRGDLAIGDAVDDVLGATMAG